MSLWSRMTRPRATARIARQLLAEQRLTRLALERIAVALEGQPRQASQQPGQAFRSPHPEAHPEDRSAISYVNASEQAKLLAIEAELTTILGRLPTEAELGAAIAEVF